MEVRATFEDNEFSSLNSDELHFLRVFIHSDGKIKDVEKAMGISYPSVKSKLSDLKEKLRLFEAKEKQISKDSNEILKLMENGEISYEEALVQIKNLKKEQ